MSRWNIQKLQRQLRSRSPPEVRPRHGNSFLLKDHADLVRCHSVHADCGSCREDTMSRMIANRLLRDDGTVAVEFAVVGLLFFALLLGSIEMGRAMWMRNSVQFAAEEAARWALVQSAENSTA